MTVVQHLDENQIDGDVAMAMLAQSPQCIKLIDPEGRVRFMSENGKRLMEIDDFAMIEGKEWWALWPEKSRSTLENAVAAAKRGMSVGFEAECPTAGGNNKHWSVRVTPITGGDLDGMIVAASEDISDRVALQQTRDKLEANNKMLRRFGRFVAHDLRGPIRHHRLLSEMIVDTAEGQDEDTASVAFASQIQESAATLLDLLSGLESLHQIEESSTHNREAMLLSELAERALEMVTQPGIQLNANCGAHRVHANRGQMISVLSNLLENARKYAKPDSLCVVDLAARSLPDDTLEITVTDNGPGFALDRIEDVFQPLVRQSNGVGIAGSGLGLALVDRIVTAHDGTVEVVKTAPSTGATIRIILPQTT